MLHSDNSTELLEPQIVAFGSKMFETLGADKPSAFNKEFWSAKVLGWAFLYPKFKINLFRLVDVLPTLRTSESIAEHITLYLADEARKINPIAGWLFRMRPHSLWGRMAASITKASVNKMSDDVIAGTDAKSALPKLSTLRSAHLAFTVDLLGEYSVSEKEAIFINKDTLKFLIL